MDRRGLTFLAAGMGLGVANVVLALLGRDLETWRVALAGGLMLVGLAILALRVRA